MVFGLNSEDIHAPSAKSRLDDCGKIELPAVDVRGQRSEGNRNVVFQTELICFELVIADQSGLFARNRDANADALQSFACPSKNRQLVINGGNDEAHVFHIANAFNNRDVVSIRCEWNNVMPVTKVKSGRQWIDICCNN